MSTDTITACVRVTKCRPKCNSNRLAEREPIRESKLEPEQVAKCLAFGIADNFSNAVSEHRAHSVTDARAVGATEHEPERLANGITDARAVAKSEREPKRRTKHEPEPGSQREPDRRTNGQARLPDLPERQGERESRKRLGAR